MHGSIFFMLKRFVEKNYDFSTWLALLEEARIERPSYEINQVYPDEEIKAIVAAASRATGVPVDKLHEAFGEYLVPDLLMMYNKYLNPTWDTFTLLQETEQVMHRAVREQNHDITPPVLDITRDSDTEMTITYSSKRKMGGVAIGIIKGIAAYYNETDHIKVTSLTDPDAEDVRIKVERRAD